ncbi:MAG TPA: cell surface protein SprA [Prolixibacteraceae bacterium]|nr:cell surface protein SprA [Prolixibacteraceae bacterium]
MKNLTLNISLLLTVTLTVIFNQSFAQGKNTIVEIDTTGTLVYPFSDEGEFQYPDQVEQGPLYLTRPSNIERKIEYDHLTEQYVIYEKIGDMYYRLPKTMSLKEYVKYDFDQSVKDYWRTRKSVENIQTQQHQGLLPQIKIESEAFSNIFGSEVIDIRPQGYVEISAGLESTFIDDGSLPERIQRNTRFEFENQINIRVNGKIGDKVNLDFNYNTMATFDFENKTNLEYTGKEDEILRRIEAGNVSLPLNGSLIQGGTNLFGVKTEMQFGRLNVTTVISQHKGESNVIETEGGAQKTKFEIKASDYDENRHFFISKYFRDNYNKALSTLPVITSPVVVNKIEVWVTNKSQNYNSSRNIIAFVDLGETDQHITNKVPEFYGNGSRYPSNSANNMYSELKNNYSNIRQAALTNNTLEPLKAYGFENVRDWERIEQSRKLSDSEFSFNPKLGFISLNSSLNNDEVLAIAFEYTVGGEVYQVGEFTTNGIESDKALILKLLKGTNLSPEMPTWNLMMKNVYSLGAYDLSPSDFDFQVLYKNESTNTFITNLPEGELKDTILLRLMNLDNMNGQNDYARNGDGMFDFVEGLTVYGKNGRIIFPVLEPFGANIADNLSDNALKLKYAYTTLYEQTKTKAEQDFSHNKFYMVGSYKGSSGSEIMLNAFNLAPGSVKVMAGGVQLIENQQYTVDYAMGRITIIDSGIAESGTPIQVSTESQELISTQRKTMLGSYANYAFSDKFNVGGTMLFMNERPITNKVELGNDPVSNLMLGLDFQYRDRSQFLTDVVNLIPFYKSNVESSISVEGEVAKLITGKSKATRNQIYIDDFEGAETSYMLSNPSGWYLASTPQGQSRFPEASLSDSLAYGYNRANLSWYYIDRLFNNVRDNTMPDYMKANADYRSNHYTRTVFVHEIFPGRELSATSANWLSVLDLTYYPREKGPYNFDSEPLSGISAGVDENNNLLKPQTRWGGMMRDITTTNFETANVEYIEFWLLDPFIYDKNGTHQGGDLYFNLGNVSEDVLKDSRKSFENGLPTSNIVESVETTAWGRVSTKTQMGSGFDNDTESRKYQDVGLDGLSDDDEQIHFAHYIDKLKDILSPDAFEKVLADPANDNFSYYRGNRHDKNKASIFERYKRYNNPDKNSPTNEMSDESYSTLGQKNPDTEDINGDNTLNEMEAYYQYRVSIRHEDLEVGQNFIVDKIEATVKLDNGETEKVTWYQFKIPVTDESSYDRVGDIYDFKSIRFIRTYLTNFSDSVFLRFGTLNLVRSDWRKEPTAMLELGAAGSSNALFEVTTINVEENGVRLPINYILPPDIEREIDPSNVSEVKMNEQSLLLKVKDLESGDARAVYKNVGVDLRQYKTLRMEVHAEAIENYPLNDNELSLFVRLGADRDNYYEYEIPLKLTPIPATRYNNDSEADREIVWPEENQLLVALSKFPELKLNRDAEVRKSGAQITRSDIYEEFDYGSPGDKNIIRIKGNPSMGEVDLVHIGIRNPKRNNLQPKTVEVWVNEFRVSDLEQKGGWASSGRMSLRLADLGSLSLSGRTQSVGWGSINQTAGERSLENKYQIDFAATGELGKLFPEKIGLKLPVFYSYSQSVANPEYNPLSSDVRLSDALDLIDSPEERDELLGKSQDVVTRKSFNMNNISIEPKRKKADRKPLPTDIENFSVSYARNEQLAHNIDLEKYLQRSEKGVFNYNFNTRVEPISPLKKVSFLKSKNLSLLRDFNFSLYPEMISFRTDLSKSYNERKARDNSGYDIDLPTTVQKNFLWNRYFDFRYNLTRGLTIDFTNQSIARIDELDGVINKNLYPDEYELMMEEIYRNISSFGRPVDYEHTITVNYRVPINKLPLLDWTSATANYVGGYEWMAAPLLANNAIELGNTVSNTMNARLNGQLNFLTLYNKVPYLKDLNSRFQSSQRTYGSRSREQQSSRDSQKKDDAPKRTKSVKYSEKKVAFRADVPKSIFHRLGTTEVVVQVLNEKGEVVEGETTVVDINRINFKPTVSVREGTIIITGTKEINELFVEKALAYSTRFLLGIRSARVTYNLTGATVLPGFMPEPYLFGMRSDSTTGGALAPSIPFLLGWQNSDFIFQAADNGWLTKDNSVQKQYMVQNSKTWNFTVQLEPISNIKIDLNGLWREAQNISSFINYNEDDLLFELLSGKESGNFEMSILTIKTLFKDPLSGDHKKSKIFDEFRYNNRQMIADRLNKQRGWVEGEGYSKQPGQTLDGVSLNSSDVIIPAFLAAYTGIDANRVPLTARPGLAWIRPNWRLNYNGNPQRIEWMKDYVTTLNFNHSYKSTYSIGRYETNLLFQPDMEGLSWVRDEFNDTTFVPQISINSVNIQEAFSPLINVDIGFTNNFTARFEIRKSRNLNFDFTSNQLNEMRKDEYSIGVGYRLSGLDMILKTRNKSENVSNDVNMRLDISSTDYKNVLRKISMDDGELSGGTKVFSADFQADYMFSDKLTIKLYYQYNLNVPHNSVNGPSRSNTRFGLSFNISIL